MVKVNIHIAMTVFPTLITPVPVALIRNGHREWLLRLGHLPCAPLLG
jgi:hypothetical protein